MIKTTALLFLSVAGWLAATSADAAQYVYPAKGQSSSRQAKDERECYAWATKQTGFDPAAPAPPPVSGDTQVTGSAAPLARAPLPVTWVSPETGGGAGAAGSKPVCLVAQA